MNTIDRLPASLEDELLSAVADANAELDSLTCTLVGFPTLNGQEAQAQDFLAARFAAMGLSVDRFEVPDEALRPLPGYSPAVGRWLNHDNVVGVHRPRTQKGRSLIFNGHIDVVPVGALDLWSSPPFEPRMVEDRIYGRGAGDMKAGIAAYIVAFEAMKKLKLQPAAPVYLQSVVEEECTGNGALACLHQGYRADAAIIPEPFQQTVMRAQVGVMWFQVEVFGRPAHVMNASQGINAIEAAFSLYQGLQGLAARWNEPACRHAEFVDVHQPARLNLGKIQGGEWASSVPTRCVMDLRLGFYPGTSTAQVRTQVEACLRSTAENDARLRGVKYRVHYTGFQAEGCVVDVTHPFLTELTAIHERVTGTPVETLASTATTDARLFNLYGGIPATCYGPHAGDIHGIDEWVSRKSTQQVCGVLALLLARWCRVEPG
jgi:acetylornithine deacetylase